MDTLNDPEINSEIKNMIDELGNKKIAYDLRGNIDDLHAQNKIRLQLTEKFTSQQLINYIVDNTSF